MPDIFLYPGAASLNDVLLRDPLVASSAGGSSYSVTVTEALAASDAVTASAIVAATSTETLSASTGEAGTTFATDSIAESVSAADVSDANLGGMSYSVDASDALTVTETITATLALVPLAIQPSGFSSSRRYTQRYVDARSRSGSRRALIPSSQPEAIPTNLELSDSLTLLDSSFASVTSAPGWSLEEEDELILAAYALLVGS